jgi:hypothetical protein
LIALMKDQVDALVRRNIAATCINSALPPGEQNQRMAKMASGDYRLVYIAPERLRNTAFLNALRAQTISLLAVDEAHCISEWGHDFRPDYLQIGPARARLGNPLTVALTATATPQVQADIIRLLNLPASTKSIVTGFNRPNLLLNVCYSTDLESKYRALQECIRSQPGKGAAIVYAGTRRDTEETAAFLSEIFQVKAQILPCRSSCRAAQPGSGCLFEWQDQYHLCDQRFRDGDRPGGCAPGHPLQFAWLPGGILSGSWTRRAGWGAGQCYPAVPTTGSCIAGIFHQTEPVDTGYFIHPLQGLQEWQLKCG